MQVDSERLSLLAYILARWIITLHVLSGGVRFESVAVETLIDVLIRAILSIQPSIM